jgi:hypothetical protein
VRIIGLVGNNRPRFQVVHKRVRALQVVSLPRRQVKACRVAQNIARRLDFFVVSPPWLRLIASSGPLFCAGAVLMGTDNGSINHGVFIVRIVGQMLENLLRNAALAPTGMSLVWITRQSPDRSRKSRPGNGRERPL